MHLELRRYCKSVIWDVRFCAHKFCRLKFTVLQSTALSVRSVCSSETIVLMYNTIVLMYTSIRWRIESGVNPDDTETRLSASQRRRTAHRYRHPGTYPHYVIATHNLVSSADPRRCPRNYVSLLPIKEQNPSRFLLRPSCSGRTKERYGDIKSWVNNTTC